MVLVAAAVLSVVELGLTAASADAYNGWWARSPDVVNFMVFNSVWSLLVLAYVGLIPIFFERLFHQLVSLGLLAVTTIFWFAGSIALAVFVPTRCGSNDHCRTMQAAVAFGFFLWAIFTGLLVLDILAVMRSRGHSTPNTKPASGGTYPGV